MIPKCIHYCWFGKGEKPHLVLSCINSWKKYLPDYEIIEWNESNFDINCCNYVKEAYEARKWAFVSDYARSWVLYNYGGLYMDTDFELKAPYDVNKLRQCFVCGFQTNFLLETHFIACESKSDLMFELLKDYKNENFINDGQFNEKTINYRLSLIIYRKYKIRYHNGAYNFVSDDLLINGINILSPNINDSVPDEAKGIHHYNGSWKTPIKLTKIQLFIFRVHGKILRTVFPLFGNSWMVKADANYWAKWLKVTKKNLSKQKKIYRTI